MSLLPFPQLVKVLKLITIFQLVADYVVSETPNKTITIKQCKCGEDYEVRGRIIGGTEAIIAEYPWQVAIYNGDSLQCGASLINDKYVMSAAHCFRSVVYPENVVIDFQVSKMTFVMGGHNLGDMNDIRTSGFPVLYRKANYTILHPLYKPRSYYCDISLTQLDKPIENYKFNILPVCLPPPRYSFVNTASVVSGWGSTAEGATTSRLLMKTNIRVLPKDICKEKLKKYYFEQVMMCAAKPGHDACQGDSGGPLVSNFGTAYYYQIGIVSYGIGCGDYNYPGAYTRVNRFLRWIMDHTKDATYCRQPQI